MGKFARCRSQADQMAVYLRAKEEGPNWFLLNGRSEYAQALARNMMNVAERRRPSCQQALVGPWFQDGSHVASSIPVRNRKVIGKYKELSSFQRSLLTKVAPKISTAETAELAAVFRTSDENNNGLLENEELENAFCNLGMDARTAGETAADLSIEHDGQVEYTNFVAGCISTLEFWREKGLDQVWRELDKENRLWVWTADFARKLQDALGLSNAEVQAVVSIFDPTRSGKISIDAFKAQFAQEHIKESESDPDEIQEAASLASTHSSMSTEASASESNVSPREALSQFIRGERLEMWSNAEQAWVEGRVEAIFARAFMLGGVYYPNGAIRITSHAGSKWLGPEHDDLFRKRLNKNTAVSERRRCRPMIRNVPKTFR